MNRFSFVAFVLILLLPAAIVSAQFRNFITVRTDKLMDGDQELRFVSFNIPNLHYIEDNQEFSNPSPWRPADEFEIRDALTAIKQLGGNVVRLYTPSVRKAKDDPGIVRHVNGPGVFDEEAFRAYDKVLQVANEVGVRVIIPFVDNWWWWGGIADYARFRGKTKEAFWTDSIVIADFKKTIAFMVNRVNTYTGVPFKEDKAILGWETGNELEVGAFSWTKEIAAYVKTLDKNHLLIEGTHSQVVLDESIAEPTIDVLSTHYYRPASQMIKLMLDAQAKAKGKKPYFVGEFGFMPADSMRSVLDAAITSGMSGILLWSMRQHNRDGGFYYHGAVFRWPGFESGKIWGEGEVMQLFKTKAFQINGLPEPPAPAPLPPTLLRAETPYKISWQGSTGASSYIIERGSSWFLFFRRWSVIDSNASDANIGYRSLFADTTAAPGVSYSYRLRAKNASGISEPSEASPAIQAPCRILIDEFQNDAKMAERTAAVSFILGKDASRAKEDWSRVEGHTGDYILYHLPKTITSIRLDAFFTTSQRDSNVVFYSGTSPGTLTPLTIKAEVYDVYSNEYKSFCPVRYTSKVIPPDHRYLRIGLQTGIQLGRLEIGYDPE